MKNKICEYILSSDEELRKLGISLLENIYDLNFKIDHYKSFSVKDILLTISNCYFDPEAKILLKELLIILEKHNEK